jgi:cell division protein FtsL
MKISTRFCNGVLLLAVVATTVGYVDARHQNRKLFNELENLTRLQEQRIEWGRLQLEQATWAENSRVEQIARERLGLEFPKPEGVVVIKQ